MTRILDQTYTLSNGLQMPVIGFGTYRLNDHPEREVPAMIAAIEAGYKMFDLAIYYHNHKQMAEAFVATNTRREDFFLVSKIWNVGNNMTYEGAVKEINLILQNLGTDYLDLLLVHWPDNNSLEVWKALEDYYEQGKLKAIGVSNFTPKQLQDMISRVRIKPMVNQVQLSPTMNRTALIELCRAENIKMMAWRTLGGPEVLANPVIQKIADDHHVTPAQVCLRWAYQQDIIIIPKSQHPERVQMNCQLDGFELRTSEMEAIFALPAKPIYWPFPKMSQTEPNWE